MVKHVTCTYFETRASLSLSRPFLCDFFVEKIKIKFKSNLTQKNYTTNALNCKNCTDEKSPFLEPLQKSQVQGIRVCSNEEIEFSLREDKNKIVGKSLQHKKNHFNYKPHFNQINLKHRCKMVSLGLQKSQRWSRIPRD